MEKKIPEDLKSTENIAIFLNLCSLAFMYHVNLVLFTLL